MRTWQTTFFDISTEQIKCVKKFWGEIYSQNRQLFESFYRFEFTFMYHEKMDFLCESTSSVNCLAALKVARYQTTQVQTEDDNTS